jgi:Cytochrome c554 and c-prime
VLPAKLIVFALSMISAASPLAAQIPDTSARPSAVSSRNGFVGDTACRPCHSAIAATYLRTAHRITSQLPSKASLSGSFAPGANVLKTSNPDLHFRMQARANGFYETAVFWQPPDEKTRTERIDLVTGSGAKGQTYLYWKGDGLFQLPVSYWTELHAWVNSPGFSDGVADFDRPIVPRCLECHATYFASISSDQADNHYRKTGFTLGISCERCHGPGGEHVGATTSGLGHSIVNPAKLSRDRQMEVCAQCHGGIGEPVAPAFSFVPGQALENFIRIERPEEDARVDVHGNQVALTQRSRCYQSSLMTCTTCHDVHAPERQPAAYSEKCLQCHKEKDCGAFVKLGQKIRENCIDCHMPVQESDLIISQTVQKQVKAKMRNHWIKVYPPAQVSEPGIPISSTPPAISFARGRSFLALTSARRPA